MNAEEWRTIANGYYEVSSLGNVRRAKPGIATFVGRPLLPVASGNGYLFVCISDGSGKQRREYVHHLVAAAFLGPRPPGFVINHKNANKADNPESNLEYVSRQENAQHALRTIVRRRGPTKPKPEPKGRPRGDRHWTRRSPERIARGSRMPHSKLTADKILEIRTRAVAGEVQAHLAGEFNISVAQMSRIVRGKRWSYVK